MAIRTFFLGTLISVIAVGIFAATRASSIIDVWTGEFPKTDFSRTSINLIEVVEDGPRRDTIPPIFDPQFVPANGETKVGPMEPVLSIIIDGDARAYPLRILLWHEIVNDVVGGVPILVSYCPLCNSGVIYDRRFDGEVLSFGNTGRIRHRYLCGRAPYGIACSVGIPRSIPRTRAGRQAACPQRRSCTTLRLIAIYGFGAPGVYSALPTSRWCQADDAGCRC